MTKSQKIGWFVFLIGVLCMVGLGWFYAWWVVPEANQIGRGIFDTFRGTMWVASIPLGAFIVAIGGALIAQAERYVLWLLALLAVGFTIWRVTTISTSSQLISPLFGIGGGLITMFFIGSIWHWSKIRQSLPNSEKIGTDLRMIGSIFFVTVAWDLCAVFGVSTFVLRPELASQFEVPVGKTITKATGILILLVLGWGFTYFGQLKSQQAQRAKEQIASRETDE
jgi:hypothetical protein